jgi:hypothetical protein
VVADVCLVTGFGLLTLGVYLTCGVGAACLEAGALLMLAGGLDARRA